MAVTKVLARKFTIEINTGTDAVPAWTPVKGLNSLSFSKSKSDTETTDFDSDGRAEHQVTERAMEIALDGFYLEDEATKARDVGQAAVETAGDALGSASLTKFRLTSPGGTIKIFAASVELGDVGGGNNDMTSWSAKLTVSGTVSAS